MAPACIPAGEPESVLLLVAAPGAVDRGGRVFSRPAEGDQHGPRKAGVVDASKTRRAGRAGPRPIRPPRLDPGLASRSTSTGQ